nr:alpha/beta hydrolase [Lysinibacillus timonensis]
MLQYTRQGKGETLVLVHGFLGAKEIFHEIIQEFTNQYDVVAVDLPGHGESQLEKENYSVYDYANAVLEVLQHEGITEATWLGHSMGGYIVLAALEGEIALVKRAILAYSSDLADTEEQKEKRSKQQREISEIGVNRFVDQIIENFFGENVQEEMTNVAKNIAYRATEKGLINALEAMKNRPDQHELLEQLSIPILVIEGFQDKIVKPVETDNPNVRKNTTMTGHLGMLEDPQGFKQAVDQFMTQ